ncbi:gliding motility-associated C-terminal domain-containing protein [Rhodocytophaga aerolata]|uniref:Gliding motility-associated C-terminal domain-containing protein n=1 Tax=Rhodocytophaga aerolata TaxID=455078 RepID=A0ABT8RHP3_9BACT|nr:gliding motility-associated C-terminal domain-containing protein [Rhodocytophaga aerolata]MDO1451241.1 gliding motility-associated C-terminal domain-containing protein [Rhodocytophaga aerolata]
MKQCNLVYIFPLLIFLYFFYQQRAFSQKQANIWYFGNKAGIDFNTSPPAPALGSAMEAIEGSATMCDKNGNLLFYTNGQTVWNQNHTILTNGIDLFGSFTSTQATLIVPQPGNDSIYYIFTTDASEREEVLTNRGLHYSVVNSKQGAVTQKNILLHATTTEKLTAVRSSDCGVWVITHPFGSDEYYVYKVSAEGVNITPVISKAGLPHQGNLDYARGQLKISPDGKRLACIIAGTSFDGSLELFDFDAKTGNISNARTLDIPAIIDGILNLYGVEFSPDNTKLYTANENKLFQYNLLENSPVPKEVASLNNSGFFALQLAPDNKIYCATSRIKEVLSVINDPNNVGTSCNFKENLFDLKGRVANIGLVNFIQSYLHPYQLSSEITVSNACMEEEVTFSGSATDTDVSWEWDFGDPDSGDSNRSTIQQPTHVFSKPGSYTVSLQATNACGESAVTSKQVNLFADPVINFAQDTLSRCYNEVPVEITVPTYAGTTLKWAQGQVTASIRADKSGWYKVTASNPCRTRTDSIYLHITPQATAYLPDDTIVCDGNFAMLDAGNAGAAYLWNTGERTRSIRVDKAGKYWVEIQNRCSAAIDTANLVFIPEEVGSFTTNVFTPNGDGVNDTFVNYVINSPGYRMQIVNRWGKEVFSSTNAFKYWDGRIQEQEAPPGVYFYFISTQDCRGQPLQIRGAVTLLR